MSEPGPQPTPHARPYRFHAFDVSYFSAKVRPALRYKGLWYEERRADVREIRERTGLAFIPVVEAPDGTLWQDSTTILEQLEGRHPEPPLFPATPVQRTAAHLVELYVDEFAVMPAMHSRWGSPDAAALARSRFIAMTGSERRGNAAADAMSAARLAVGATDAAAPALEAHLRDLLDALSALFASQPYLLGDRMSFADCALMGPLYGHLFVDVPSRRLLLETATAVVGWIERCLFPHADEQGAWLARDALSPAFAEVLALMGRDAAPVIGASLAEIDRWADANAPDQGPERALPRAVGRCESTLRGVSIERVVQSYTGWMARHALAHHAALAAPERAQVDAALAGSGWEPLLGWQPRHPIRKRGYDLAFAPAAAGARGA